MEKGYYTDFCYYGYIDGEYRPFASEMEYEDAFESNEIEKKYIRIKGEKRYDNKT